MSPPKAKPDPCRTPLQLLEWKLAYHFLVFLQLPFDFGFWLIEQAKARLQDLLANEGIEP